MFGNDTKRAFKLIGISIGIYLVFIGFTFGYSKPINYIVTLGWVLLCIFVYIKWRKRINPIDLSLFNAVFFCMVGVFSLAVIGVLKVNVFVDKNIEYATCTYKNLVMAPPQSNLTNIDVAVLDLYGKPVENISPVMLNSVFELGGNGTNLQRENVENSIKGKVVVWRLKVYEVRRKQNGTFRIITQTGEVDRRSEIQKHAQAFLDIGNVMLGQGPVLTGRYENQNVGTFIDLTLRNGGDLEYLGNLQTGSWITIRGKITGVSLRTVDISPAVLEQTNNTTLYSQAYERKKEFEKKMDDYKNRSCVHVWLNKFDVRELKYTQEKNGSVFVDDGYAECDKNGLHIRSYIPQMLIGKSNRNGIFFYGNERVGDWFYGVFDLDAPKHQAPDGNVYAVDMNKSNSCRVTSDLNVKFMNKFVTCKRLNDDVVCN